MIETLTAILSGTAPSPAMNWLAETLDQQHTAFQQRKFYYAFSGATRHFGKTPVTVTPTQADRLDAALPGFTLHTWTEDQLARCILLLLLGAQTSERYRETLIALIDHADVREAIALYAAFPLLPEPAFLLPLARAALRTNMISVFDAMALRNPFPAEYFDDEGWNQMILKCCFLQRPTHLVFGLDRRANVHLATALSNYAHERWAAHRPVTPDLWRSCSAYVSPQIAADLSRAAASPEPGNREAAALVVSASASPLLEPLRAELTPELEAIREGSLTWACLGSLLYPDF